VELEIVRRRFGVECVARPELVSPVVSLGVGGGTQLLLQPAGHRPARAPNDTVVLRYQGRRV